MEHDQVIKNAQYRKNLSIAFFNSTNAAIEMVKLEFGALHSANPTIERLMVERLEFWRTNFLEAHKRYYATVIESIGADFNVEETLARIAKVENMEQLQLLWVSLSQDERNNPEVFAAAQLKKNEYEKAQ